MKPLKYTVAALAILAAASFSTSANAALTAGSLVLGVEDTTGSVSNDLEVNLGTFATLSNNETWNLGTSQATVFGSTSTLEFNIAGTGGAGGGGGLNSAKEIAFTAESLPSFTGN